MLFNRQLRIVGYMNSISVKILCKFLNYFRSRPNIEIDMDEVVPDKPGCFNYLT